MGANGERDSAGLHRVVMPVVLLVFGLSVAFGATYYDIGRLARMGPGYFPMLLGLALCVISILIFLEPVPDRTTDDAAPDNALAMNWRAVAFPLGGILAFAFLIRSFGFLPATFACSLLSSLAERESGWLPRVLSSLLLAGFTSAVFVYGLGIPVRLMIW